MMSLIQKPMVDPTGFSSPGLLPGMVTRLLVSNPNAGAAQIAQPQASCPSEPYGPRGEPVLFPPYVEDLPCQTAGETRSQ